MKEAFFKYVPNGFVHVWEKEGWIPTAALTNTHHGAYSTLMQWKGEGNPVCPPQEAVA